jgi:hypothetical protein
MRAASAKAEGISYFGLRTDIGPFAFKVKCEGDETAHMCPDMKTARMLAIIFLNNPAPVVVRITAREVTRDEGERDGLVAVYQRIE